MKKIYVKIEGITCSHCESKIKKALLENKKIKDVGIEKNIAHISYQGKLNKEELIEPILALDYFTKEEYISDHLKSLNSTIQWQEFVLIFGCILLFSYLIYQIFSFNILNMIPTIDSSITYGMLIVTGMLTSIHCISMCGAINLIATVTPNYSRNLKRPLLYNLGRVISYTIIGGIAGAIGSVLSIHNTITGIIILLASLVMLGMSFNMLGIISFKLPRFIKWKPKRKSTNSFVVGILNGFMPCGPLQAMQLYALSTGSIVTGAFSMFLFGIGTVPLMLLVGVLFNVIKGKGKILINKIAAVLILVLSLVMLNRGLLTLNIDVFQIFNQNDSFQPSIIYEDYQVVEFDLSYDHYQDIILQKDIPVKMIIHVDKKYLTGCNNELIIKNFNIKQFLEVGDNIIEFTPTETGTFTYTCWMSMIKNNIKVIDNPKYFETGEEYE